MIRDIIVIICCIVGMLTIAIGASLMFHEEPQGEPVPILNVTNDKHTCYIPEDMREGL